MVTKTTPEVVAVKDFKGRLLIRWLVGTTPDVAYVTDKQGASAVEAGAEAAYTVGFPLADVYYQLPSIRTPEGKEPEWALFRPRF